MPDVNGKPIFVPTRGKPNPGDPPLPAPPAPPSAPVPEPYRPHG